MFCPQCGQQSSDEIRFCPRCGLSLAPHAALLSVGNTAARGAVVAQSPPARSAKRVQMRRAAKLMFFSVVLFPLFLGLSIATDGPAGLLLSLAMFLGGWRGWFTPSCSATTPRTSLDERHAEI